LREAGDKDSIGKLEAVGTPPRVNPRNSGTVRRVVLSAKLLFGPNLASRDDRLASHQGGLDFEQRPQQSCYA
jgi:hypothetical protein